MEKSKQCDQDQTEVELREDPEVILGETDQPDSLDQEHPQAIEVNRTGVDAYNNLGNALVGRGKLKEAVQAYHRALEANPNDADTYNNLGNVLVGQGKLEEAVQAYHQALEINSSDADVHYNLGRALVGQGKLEEAVRVYHQALGINSDDADVYYYLGKVLTEQGKLEEAIQSYAKALEINPDLTAVCNNLGLVLQRQGRLEEAVQVYHRALEISPDDASTHNNLGNALQKQDELEAAVQAYVKALEIDPSLSVVHNNLGPVLQKQGRLAEAVQVYHRALEISPGDASTHNNLGNALKQQGRLERAIQAYHRATEINPNYVKPYNNLGLALQKQGKLEEAVQAYHRALEISSNDASIYNNLGNVLQEQGKLELAIQAYRFATEINPNYPQAYNNLGNIFRQQDRLEEAIQAYQGAIGIDTGYAEAHGNLGNLLRELGRLEPAIQAYRKVLSINPNTVATHYMLAKTKEHGSYDHEICAMEALLENPSITNMEKVDLYFALGKAFEDLQMYEKAFDFFSIGNKTIRGTIEYDISQDEDFFKRLMNTFSKPFLDRHSGCGFDDDTPIFILGMPRSGTSLVEQILSGHNKVYGAGELYDLQQVILTFNPKGTHHKFPDHLDQLDWDEFAQFGINYVKRLRKYSPHAYHITDKIPANFLYIGMIKLILPNAKVIHCQRNPIDTCLSCFKNRFALGHRFSYDLQELGKYYQLYRKLMSHWDDVLPNYIFHFQYEDLIVNQETQTRLLLEHCGLEWEESCLSFHQTERLVRTMSASQVRRPLYGDSVGLWKKYETQLQPLTSKLTATE